MHRKHTNVGFLFRDEPPVDVSTMKGKGKLCCDDTVKQFCLGLCWFVTTNKVIPLVFQPSLDHPKRMRPQSLVFCFQKSEARKRLARPRLPDFGQPTLTQFAGIWCLEIGNFLLPRSWMLEFSEGDMGGLDLFRQDESQHTV